MAVCPECFDHNNGEPREGCDLCHCLNVTIPNMAEKAKEVMREVAKILGEENE